MKRATNRLLFLLMTLTYVLSYMGFGVHICHDDGSRHFVWLIGDISCEAIHHHSHGSDHDHHHGDCCTTQVYVLTDAQDSDNGTIRPACTQDCGLPAVVETPCLAVMLPSAVRPVLISDTPPPIAPPSPSLLSVWLV